MRRIGVGGTSHVALMLLVISPVGLLIGLVATLQFESEWPVALGIVWFVAAPVIALMRNAKPLAMCTRRHRSRWEQFFWCKGNHPSDVYGFAAVAAISGLAAVASVALTNALAFVFTSMFGVLFVPGAVARWAARRESALLASHRHDPHGRTTPVRTHSPHQNER